MRTAGTTDPDSCGNFVAVISLGQRGLCLQPWVFFGVSLRTSISNDRSQCKNTATKKGRPTEDSDFSGMKVWVTVPSKECKQLR